MLPEKSTLTTAVRLIVGEGHDGQRLDNYILSRFPRVPKSRIYRAIRQGEVRVNGRRAKPLLKLNAVDEVRIPPMYHVERDSGVHASPRLIERELSLAIVYEDDDLLVLNKPSGIAVHGGSGLSWGMIEGLRILRPREPYLELVHRLDRETSGCLLVAKRRGALRQVQRAFREHRVQKIYWAIVAGDWQGGPKTVRAPLLKNTLRSGERMVRVDPAGKPAHSLFSPLDTSARAALVQVEILTGRTHQIRVHSAHLAHPIIGDAKYGSSAKSVSGPNHDKMFRLCLHARAIKLPALRDLAEKSPRFIEFQAFPPSQFVHTAASFGLSLPKTACFFLNSSQSL